MPDGLPESKAYRICKGIRITGRLKNVQYYFTVAQLPFLRYDNEKFMSPSEFLEICPNYVSNRDMNLLTKANIHSLEIQGYQPKVLELFLAFEKGLRNELVLLRAGKKGIEPGPFLKTVSDSSGLKNLAREAFEEESPLTAEAILNRARWDYLDELEGDHYFDIEKLILYYLKLQILERQASFDQEKGKALYNSIILESKEIKRERPLR